MNKQVIYRPNKGGQNGWLDVYVNGKLKISFTVDAEQAQEKMAAIKELLK
jgi:hypothetical protein